jgi:hypothetical protein
MVTVGALVAGLPGPKALEAVTVAVIVEPTSAATIAYVLLAAPTIGAHVGEHRFHPYWNDVGVFDHVPVDTITV